jgi:hypothetical protein
MTTMTRFCRVALPTVLCAIGVCVCTASAVAESKIATVTLHAVKVAERKIEVRFDDSELVIPFELSKDARVQIDRKKVALSELKKGQTATLIYDSEKRTVQLLRVSTEDGAAPRGVFRSGRPKSEEELKTEEKPDETPEGESKDKNEKPGSKKEAPRPKRKRRRRKPSRSRKAAAGPAGQADSLNGSSRPAARLRAGQARSGLGSRDIKSSTACMGFLFSKRMR